ncbi:MAG: sterol desaturase family protein [Acidimicrobiia bacterium]
MPAELGLVLVAFVLMEPAAYLAHRYVMHGRLGAWHVGHHQVRLTLFEANDLYPVVAAVLTIAAIAAGTFVDGLSALAWVGLGVTLYGMAYLFVHDIYIHRRIPGFTWRCAPLERVREAHRIHHLWAGEPYGFLLPVVPRELRERAQAVTRDPLVPAPR